MNIATDFQTLEAKRLVPLAWKWDTREALIDEVWSGLLKRPRSLVPWMLYDSEGSRLFECITTLPELSHANGAGHFGELCRSDYHGDWF